MASAWSVERGPSSTADHDSAQNRFSPSFIWCRARARLPSMPRRMSVVRRTFRSPPVASAWSEVPGCIDHSAGVRP